MGNEQFFFLHTVAPKQAFRPMTLPISLFKQLQLLKKARFRLLRERERSIRTSSICSNRHEKIEEGVTKVVPFPPLPDLGRPVWRDRERKHGREGRRGK